MAIKNDLLGGVDYTNGSVLDADELNDTNDAIIQNTSLLGDNTSTFTAAVTTATSTIDISGVTDCSSIILENVGDNTIFFRFAATAVVTDFPLYAGESIGFLNVNFSRIDVITASGTSNLNVVVNGNTGKAGIYDEYELLTLSATEASDSETFTNTTNKKNVIVANTGANDVFITLGATATTSNYKLSGGEILVLGLVSQNEVAGICSAGQTTTVKILGVY